MRTAEWKGGEFQPVQNSSMAFMASGTKSSTKTGSCPCSAPSATALPTPLHRLTMTLPSVIPRAYQVLHTLHKLLFWRENGPSHLTSHQISGSSQRPGADVGKRPRVSSLRKGAVGQRGGGAEK